MTRKGALLDPLLKNKEKTVNNVKPGLAAMTKILEFKVLRGISKTNSRITTLYFRKADIGLFRILFGTSPGEIVLEGKRLGDLIDFLRRASSEHKD